MPLHPDLEDDELDRPLHLVHPIDMHRRNTPKSPMSAVIADTDTSKILKRLDAAEGKIDALITDGRGDHALLHGCRRELRAMRHHVTELDKKAQYAATAGDLAELRGVVLAVSGKVGTVETVLGKPPMNPRESQTGQYTSAQLAEMSDGTGMQGTLWRLVAGQAQLVRRVGVMVVLTTAASNAPDWVPAVMTSVGVWPVVSIVVAIVAGLVAFEVSARRSQPKAGG